MASIFNKDYPKKYVDTSFRLFLFIHCSLLSCYTFLIS
jgi:hypothetical protein